MKIIINASNLTKGGGIQVALSFINECAKNFNNNFYYVLIGNSIANQIDINSFPSNFIFYNISIVSRPSIKRIKVLKQLKKIENDIKPNCVISVFGPSYWTPKATHIMGFAIAHFLYPESIFFKNITFKENLKWKFLKLIKRYYFKKDSKYYLVETDDVRNRLSGFLNKPKENIFTVSNTHNAVFKNFVPSSSRLLTNKEKKEFRLLTLSTYYSHKNFEIINKVVPVLNSIKIDYVRFVLTLEEETYSGIFSNEAKKFIINIGPVKIEDCPQLYFECDAVFLPSLLECFSANYPEAMIMQKPILTSDLPFAHDICESSAVYFNPADENSIVNSIISIIEDNELRNTLIINGLEQLKKFKTPEERTKEYLSLCKKVS